MTLAFYIFSCCMAAFLFSIWETDRTVNVFLKMYFLILAVYFGYNAFNHPVFQSILN